MTRKRVPVEQLSLPGFPVEASVNPSKEKSVKSAPQPSLPGDAQQLLPIPGLHAC